MNKKVNKKNKEIVNCELNKVFLGIFIVVFGLIILLNNLSVITLNVNMWLIWPIFIIFLGLSLFTKKDVVSTTVGLVVSVMAVVLICVSLFETKTGSANNVISNFPIVVSQTMEIERAKIQIDSAPKNKYSYPSNFGIFAATFKVLLEFGWSGGLIGDPKGYSS